MFRFKGLLGLSLVLFMPSAASAQTVDRAAVAKQLEVNERAVNAAFAKGDAATIKKYLAADATALDGGGVQTIAAMLAMLPQMKIESWAIDSYKVTWISDTTAVATYRFTGKGTMAGQPLPSTTWSSTVWTNRGGSWVAAFHQESVAEPPAK
jgi:hypothetical protein